MAELIRCDTLGHTTQANSWKHDEAYTPYSALPLWSRLPSKVQSQNRLLAQLNGPLKPRIQKPKFLQIRCVVASSNRRTAKWPYHTVVAGPLDVIQRWENRYPEPQSFILNRLLQEFWGLGSIEWLRPWRPSTSSFTLSCESALAISPKQNLPYSSSTLQCHFTRVKTFSFSPRVDPWLGNGELRSCQLIAHAFVMDGLFIHPFIHSSIFITNGA